eukprot:CAMPEP_0168610060 /NCGR_PEP_ID=MMETSP0449_2-20121227/1562_1 /TAXON_ID=1082188 /ORGANISM="Strombidium rassoulzadegani, Strain ras09" /LENGTH=245 /DNA_ID=CAMNT_0008650293 /DNA_START=600 /DNA_END=1332 /DNA_ORIENTATION=+
MTFLNWSLDTGLSTVGASPSTVAPTTADGLTIIALSVDAQALYLGFADLVPGLGSLTLKSGLVALHVRVFLLWASLSEASEAVGLLDLVGLFLEDLLGVGLLEDVDWKAGALQLLLDVEFAVPLVDQGVSVDHELGVGELLRARSLVGGNVEVDVDEVLVGDVLLLGEDDVGGVELDLGLLPRAHTYGRGLEADHVSQVLLALGVVGFAVDEGLLIELNSEAEHAGPAVEEGGGLVRPASSDEGR